MDLKTLVKKVQVTVKDEKTIQNRLEFAEHIASHYKFTNPKLVLLYTHPEMSRLPLSDKCKMLGTTEEEVALFSTQKGFQNFLKDYTTLSLTSLQNQATQKLAASIPTERVVTDKYGTREDFTIERDLTAQLSQRLTPRANTQVNVQVNTLWEQARQKAQARLDGQK